MSLARIRASTSVEPPAEKPTTIRTGFVGYEVWAWAGLDITPNGTSKLQANSAAERADLNSAMM